MRVDVTNDSDEVLMSYSTDPNDEGTAPGADVRAEIIEALEDALAFLRSANGEEPSTLDPDA
jgi:hypothetical protein